MSVIIAEVIIVDSGTRRIVDILTIPFIHYHDCAHCGWPLKSFLWASPLVENERRVCVIDPDDRAYRQMYWITDLGDHEK